MMRSVVIFSFFALATVLVIILQPGPRSEFTYDAGETNLQETSRNQGGVLDTAKVMPALEAPDDVISKLKAAATPERQTPQIDPQTNGSTSGTGSLSKLQAALDASLGNTPAVVPETAPEARSEPIEVPQRTTTIAAAQSAVAPELRDMSWQTLNALNNLGQVAKAPGQEGSLLNSIVRRSMGQVGSAPTSAPVRATTTNRVNKPRVEPAKPARAAKVTSTAPRKAVRQTASVQSNYVVASGDTLALIAIKLYGTALAIDDLLAQNPSLRRNPNSLRIGQVLQYTY